MPASAGQRAQPRGRPVQQHAAAVAGDAVGADAAAMRHARERDERLVDDPRAGLAVDVGDDAEAAAVVLERRVVKTWLCRHAWAGFRAATADARQSSRTPHDRPECVGEAPAPAHCDYSTFAALRQSSLDG